MLDMQKMCEEYGFNIDSPIVQNLLNSMGPGSNLPGSFCDYSVQEGDVNSFIPTNPFKSMMETPYQKLQREQEKVIDNIIHYDPMYDGPSYVGDDGYVHTLNGKYPINEQPNPAGIGSSIPLADFNIGHFAQNNDQMYQQNQYDQYYNNPNPYANQMNQGYYNQGYQQTYNPYVGQNYNQYENQNYYGQPYQQQNQYYNQQNQYDQYYNNTNPYANQMNQGYYNQGYQQQPCYYNQNEYVPMVYNHEEYNRQLLQQYYANGCQTMYVRRGDDYEEYNPGFEYYYYPSTEEKNKAYKYFSDRATPQDTADYFSSDLSVIPSCERKYKEWLAQFAPMEMPSPEEQIMAFLERRNGPHDESDEHFHEVARKLFEEGKISLAEYTSVANGGIEYVTDNGVTVNRLYENQIQNSYSPFGWGGYNYMNQQAYEQQMQAQEAYEQHNIAMQMAYDIARRFNGITDEDIKHQQEQQMIDFMNQLNYNIKINGIARYEYKIDSFAQHAQSGMYSYEKGYVSPAKQKFIDHYDKVYEERHRHVAENMSFKDFMIGGGYADIYFADMKYENRKAIQKLANLYDDIMCRGCINEISPFYDPKTGKAPRGLKINRNEIEISVPPELLAESYDDRKKEFFNQISKGHKHPLQDVEYFAGQYIPNMGMTQNGMVAPPNAYMRL